MNVISENVIKWFQRKQALVKGDIKHCSIKDDIVKKIIGDEKRITCRPADLIEPELDKIRNEMKEYLETG